MIFSGPTHLSSSHAQSAGMRPRLAGGGRGVAMKSERGAYTVIELLVVMSIMAIGFGAYSYARINRPGTNLKLVQSEVAALVNFARLQARISVGKSDTTDYGAARLLIYGDKSTDKDKNLYMRQMQVVVPDPANKGSWITAGSVRVFPQGIYVVHPRPQANWDGGKLRTSKFYTMGGSSSKSDSKSSSGSAQAADNPSTMKVNEVSARYFYIEFSSLGTVGSGEGAQPDVIVLSEGVSDTRPSAAEPMLLTNPKNIRGINITEYGNPVLLNDVYDFPTKER